jgi:hypothetical protein
MSWSAFGSAIARREKSLQFYADNSRSAIGLRAGQAVFEDCRGYRMGIP